MLSGNLDLLDEALTRIQPKDHLCLIHKNQEELENVIIPYIVIGLKNNEKCLYIGDRDSLDSVRSMLLGDGLQIELYEAAGQLLMLDSAVLFHNNVDQLDFNKVLDLYKQECQKALQEGFNCLRISDDLSWAITKQLTYEDVFLYEEHLNRDIISTYSCILLCQYNQRNFDARTIRRIVAAHPVIIHNGKIHLNISYLPTETQHGNNADYQLQEWFNKKESMRLFQENQLEEQMFFCRDYIDNIPAPIFCRDTKGSFQYYPQVFPSFERTEAIENLQFIVDGDLAPLDLHLAGISREQCYNLKWSYSNRERTRETFQNNTFFGGEDFSECTDTKANDPRRKSDQEALRLSEERFKRIFTQSPFGMAIYDYNGALVEMNRACREIIGIKNIEDMEKLSLANIDVPKEAKEKLKRGETLHFEQEFDYDLLNGLVATTKSGVRYLNCFISPLNYKPGDKLGSLFQIQDITEQKKTELALKRSNACLRRLTDNMVEIISQVNIEGVYEYVSPSCKTILGYEPEELYNTSIFNLLHPDDINLMMNYITAGLKTRSFKKTDFRFRCADGTYLFLNTVGNLFCDDDGRIGGVILSSHDVSENKKVEGELARLDQLRMVGEMAASVAHEIRNPMTTVRGFLQVLGDNDEHANLKEYFDLMIEELDSANAIISEYLSLAKEKTVFFANQDLNKLIEAIYPLIVVDAIKSDQRVILELGEIPSLYIDAKEIRQLVLNLTRNGLESMGPGGCLTIRTTADEQNIILSIEDQGHGIDDNNLEKIGIPFFTTKDQGTGLGLSICNSIAARHKATIDIKSNQNGSTFSVVFRRFDMPTLI